MESRKPKDIDMSYLLHRILGNLKRAPNMCLHKIVFEQNSLILESCKETQDMSLFLLGVFFLNSSIEKHVHNHIRIE